MNAEDGFEEELSVRLGARAAGIGGSPPLAELREAGRRRARRRAVVRAVTAVAVLAVGAGVLTQVGGGSGPGRTGAAGAGVALMSPTTAATGAGPEAVILECAKGPTAMRTPGWHQHPAWTPPAVPSSGAPSSNVPSSNVPSSGAPSSNVPSSNVPSSGAPSSNVPSSNVPSSRVPSSGAPSSLSSAGPSSVELGRAGVAVEMTATMNVLFREHYFGTCRDADTNTLYVMRVPGSELDVAATRAVADRPWVKLRFVDAAGSRDQLTAFGDRIRADAEEWRSKGVEIEAVTLAVDGTGVVVDTPQWASAGAEIKAKYGPLVAEVR
ncbi:hypothetical protein ACFV1W_01485 [Kitasatospora sp. NPDC059648]|uniref:hypothetical protein n=1 Tax=Kitasatospora sp. NPDC059648 TaxID=3346894 RepID=UPI00368793D9